MTVPGSIPVPPNLHANDAEVQRYAALLDSLGIGLLVFTAEGTPCLRNVFADRMLGKSPSNWIDEAGNSLDNGHFPVREAIAKRSPVNDRVLGFSAVDGEEPVWVRTNALPVMDESGTLRRVLLTLDNITHLKKLEVEINELSYHDPLTGAFNHRRILHLLEDEIHRARRYGTPFTVAKLDIDNFTAFCDQHGQQTGNQVLAEVGRLICGSVREIDLVGRMSFDEFLLILPNVRLNDAIAGVERLRAMIDAEAFTEKALPVTISGGVTEYAGESSAILLERSHTLLLQARDAGRNRLCQDVDMF